MTDLTIEHEGETLYVVPAAEMPDGLPCKGRKKAGEWHWKAAAKPGRFTLTSHYVVTLAQRIAMLKMKAASGDGVVPDDLDPKGRVLLRSGLAYAQEGGCDAMRWGWLGDGGDIVAYTPLAKPAPDAARKTVAVEYDPETHVLVRRMTAEECEEIRLAYMKSDTDNSALFYARRLSILIEPAPVTPPDPYEAWLVSLGIADGQPVTRALYERLQGEAG